MLFKREFVVNTRFKVIDCFSVLGKFAIDTEFLDIENRDGILQLSQLTENGFLVDT